MGDVHILEWLAPAVPDEGVDWEAVYREEMSRVFNYFRYRGLSPPVAEDLTSATFEKAWRARGRYRKERASVATWLLAIARNVAIDHFRRPRPEEPLLDEMAGSAETPESAALRASQSRRLRELLKELPERERELVALKYGADVTNRAIATLTGLSESNVGTILHRTVVSLRARWDEGGPR
jgi:RNA polymerase sigma-70 factor (ECF subfamily)